MNLKNQIILLGTCAAMVACANNTSSTPSSALSGDMITQLSKSSKQNDAAVEFIRAQGEKDRAVMPSFDLLFSKKKDVTKTKSYLELNAAGVKWLETIRAKCKVEVEKTGDQSAANGPKSESKTLGGPDCPLTASAIEESVSAVENVSHKAGEVINNGRISHKTTMQSAVSDAQLQADSGEVATQSVIRTEARYDRVMTSGKKITSGELRSHSEGTLSIKTPGGIITGVMKAEFVLRKAHREGGIVMSLQTPQGPVTLASHLLNDGIEYRINGRLVTQKEMKRILGSLPLDKNSL